MIGETAYRHHRAAWKRLADRIRGWRVRTINARILPALDVRRLVVCGTLTEVTR